MAVLLLALSPGVATAGERYLGRILASDAGTANNFNTGYLTAGCSTTTGTCDQAFAIPVNAKLTVQCDEAALVAANAVYVDAGRGLALTAAQMFPTSTGAAVSYSGIGGRTDDAGTFYGGVISVAPAVGASSARCRVYSRSGTE